MLLALDGAKKNEKRNAFVISIDNPYNSAYNRNTKVWLPKYKSVALKVKLLHYIIFSLHSDIYYCIFQYDNMASDMASQIPSIFLISTISECHKKK